MRTETIESIQGRIEADKDLLKDLDAYQNMVDLEWNMPEEWSKRQWMRKQISTDAHDAIKTATNIYDTNSPHWEILPRGMADKDRAEQLETALEWWMQRANKLGEHEPLRKALHNSCLQNCVIMQIDYLPYWLGRNKSKWTKEQKQAMKQSSFCITVHDRRSTFYESGKYGLKWVATVTVMCAQDVINHWGAYESDSEEGKQIKRAISKMKSELDNDEELKYIHVDYVDHDKREVSVFPTQSDSINDFVNYDGEGNQTGKIDILDTDYKLSFINYVIVTGESSPMLYGIHHSGLWENQNLYDTLIDSTYMRRAVFPILKHTSPTGKELEVDYRGDQDVLEMQNGEQADTLAPPPIDPALSQVAASNTGKISQATGVKGLNSIEIAGNVQYAAVQSVIDLHLTTLKPFVRTAEKAFSQAGDIMFMWIKESNGYEEVYRTEDKGVGMEKGMGFTVSPKDFDPDDLFIECELTDNTPTNKQQKVNILSSLKQAGAHIAWKPQLEKLGFGNGDINEAEWLEEETTTAALQQKIKEMDMQLQEMMKDRDMQRQQIMQQQQMEMQAQQQQALQEQQGQVPPDQSNPMIPNGGGFNAAMGGQSTGAVVQGATSPVQ